MELEKVAAAIGEIGWQTVEINLQLLVSTFQVLELHGLINRLCSGLSVKLVETAVICFYYERQKLNDRIWSRK